MKKITIWGCGLVAALTLGLSGCLWDEGSEPVDYSSKPTSMNSGSADNTSSAEGTKSTQKSYSSKDPVQKTTPGPKRAAAPQMPVLQ
ncbi:MAG: hypothetical protein EPN84_05435 [Legionella sp.]|nr:MAG: hypothetical protein EPN84_05435 [Legionella sp.]